MNCPVCANSMVKARATSFGEEYDYCRTCKKELAEMIAIPKLRIAQALDFTAAPINHVARLANIANTALHANYNAGDTVYGKYSGISYTVAAVDRKLDILLLVGSRNWEPITDYTHINPAIPVTTAPTTGGVILAGIHPYDPLKGHDFDMSSGMCLRAGCNATFLSFYNKQDTCAGTSGFLSPSVAQP